MRHIGALVSTGVIKSRTLPTIPLSAILFLLFFPIVLFLLTASPIYASHADCSPNAITSSTVYSNYIQADDSYIAFTYNVDAACHLPSNPETVSIALVALSDVLTEALPTIKDAFPVVDAGFNDQVLYGNTYISSGFTAVAASNWALFYTQLSLQRTGNPGLVEILLYEARAGGGDDQYLPQDAPSNNLDLHLIGRGLYNGSVLAVAGFTDVLVYFDSGPVLHNGTNNYVIALRAEDGDASNYVTWRTELNAAGGPYVGGITTDGGDAWSTIDVAGAGVHPYARWYGSDLVTAFDSVDILTKYTQDTFASGARSGSLEWPQPLSPGDYQTISDYVLIILNETDSPTVPDTVHRLSDACLIVRTDPVPSGFVISGLGAFVDQNRDVASNIPILNVLMGDTTGVTGPVTNLALGLGLDTTNAFLLITIAFSFAFMLLISRVTSNKMAVLLGGTIPVAFMVSQGLLPMLVMIAAGLFVVMIVTWQMLVRQDI